MALWEFGQGGRGGRRALMRTAAGAATASVAAGLAAGRGPGGVILAAGAAAAPTTQPATIQLVFQANRQGVSLNKTLLTIYQDFVDQTFNQQKGLHATVYPGDWGNPGGVITASIAGRGFPDVVASCCSDIVNYTSGDWLVPLDSYLKADNIATTVWNGPHVQALTFGGQILALPSYDGPGIVAYRQDILDGLGLDYPDPTWTYQDAAALWEQCATSTYQVGGNTKRRLGISFLSLDDGHLNWWMNAWGGQEMDPTRTQCLADSTPGVGALAWLAGLQTSNVGISDSGEVDRLTGAASAAFAMVGGWNVFPLALQLGTQYKWDLLPVPTFPNGRATYCNIDFYGINRATPNLDASWTLMKYLTYETAWQEFQMKTTLVQPCLNSLWSEWETIVKAVAPPLQSKQLQWFQDASQGGYAWPSLYFAYNAGQATTVLDAALNNIGAGKISAQAGLTQMSNQINAIVATGKAEADQTASITAKFPTNGPAMAGVVTGI